MKTFKTRKHLMLNKKTIANLNTREMRNVWAGFAVEEEEAHQLTDSCVVCAIPSQMETVQASCGPTHCESCTTG